MTGYKDVHSEPQETPNVSENTNVTIQTGNADDVKTENTESSRLPDEWMIRGSATYEDEYLECKSIRARFHQYFIFGEIQDCSQWKKDLENCQKWEQDKSEKAYKELVESEKIRRRERLRGHIMNDVWEKRESPPPDWNKPLPEFMQKQLENTYLSMKKEQRAKGLPAPPDNVCIIL